MELTLLGTGHAAVTRCYNTCFLLREGEEAFLVDTGGGNGILQRLEAAGTSWRGVHTLFVTHKHLDHITGALWLLRMWTSAMAGGKMGERVTVYGHDKVIRFLDRTARTLFPRKQTRLLGTQVRLEPVEDGEERTVLGRRVTFFDLRSAKEKQFGFSMDLGGGRKLTCLGDEPYRDHEEPYARGAAWLLHEAFCLRSEAERFHPYEKHHSTAADACALAEELGVENLILYHTEDSDLPRRKARYTAEGSPLFSGALHVPDDLERFIL